MAGQLRLLTLNEGENLEHSLFRLEKGWTLHFILGPSLSGQNVHVFVNHPADASKGPDRNNYRELSWQNLSGTKSDVYDNFAECKIVLAGSFNYFFTTDGSDEKSCANGCGNFLVDPILRVGQEDDRLPLDCIQCQSVLAKQLGPFEEWADRLRVAKESGYNMIHFTPLQELGYSDSAYSLADQLQLNHIFSPGDKKHTFSDLEKFVKFMKTEWKMLSLTDLVYNHTANNSPWIQEHPECAYNLVNSPHLRPAYLLDRILWHFSLDVASGRWKDRGIPLTISTEEHLKTIRSVLSVVVLPKHKIYEFYMVDIEDIVKQFKTRIPLKEDIKEKTATLLEIIPDPKYRRLRATVDIQLALKLFNVDKPGAGSEVERINWCCEALRYNLQHLNNAKQEEVQHHLVAAMDNFIANARWRFVDPAGEKLKVISEDSPLMWNYFLLPREEGLTIEQEEELMYTSSGAYAMAHNGWVMNDDPMRNFAEPGSNIYLRRELIVWGDSVKLRYGNSPSDNPYLWKRMLEYTVLTARIFHGVRLDNCHSTPIHVAEYMLDEARKVRPDLYVIAELFTRSEHTDNIFINRLGLNSLIREALSAWDSHEQGRLVYRYGGLPVGSFFQPPARPLAKTVAHAIFFDQTHDNPSPIEKRSVYDVLPSAALVAMACCASGSNRGYDELIPHHIHVVSEKRLYSSFTDEARLNRGQVNRKTGIIAAKQALNRLHQELGYTGFSQLYVDQVDKDIVAVTRHCPVSHQSVILVTRTAFGYPSNLETGYVPPLCVPGKIEEIILEAKTVKKGPASPFVKDDDFLNGQQNYGVNLREHLKLYESEMVELKEGGNALQEIEFINFPPGSVIAFRISLHANLKAHVMSLRTCLTQFGYRMRTYSGRSLQEITGTEIENIATRLNLNDLSRVLYRCDAEEKDDGLGFGAYDVPGYGPLPYCGLQGVVSILAKIRNNNDLGHPLCENLRNGDWMPQYIANRLIKNPTTKELGRWFDNVFKHLVHLPRYLIPGYFDAVITGVYVILEEVAWAKLSEFVSSGSFFVRSLAMGSLQMCSVVKTAPLPILSPNLVPPHPPTKVNEETGKRDQACLSLSAGLPHFSSGIFRNWGRDTFISMRGLLLLTGRFDEARFIILAYAACLRHGLIPNLLGAGSHARYNCRDAVWWWLECIQQFCQMAPQGSNILKDKVSRIFPTDDSLPENPGIVDQPLCDVIQEALQKHADGVKYRERHAGPAIDNDMSNEGFNSELGVDWETGFVYGGNEHNCGTWMDKMGSSVKAGNKGKPATPRDGSAIELIGLCKSTVRWLSKMHGKGEYPYDGVERIVDRQKVKVTFSEWNRLLQENFEKYFWVNTEPVPENEPKPDLIHTRGMFKDSVNATQFWADYQLRPNFPISMVVAPEMFTAENAWHALSLTEDRLLGPLGMKTLDPKDWAYNGNYINSDDSMNHNTAKGFNYHQGPEWVWPLGYFLRAKLHFARILNEKEPGLLTETVNFIKGRLSLHNVHIQASDWRSLPELTNKDGTHCADSCEAQAWSVACILEVLYDLEQLTLNQQ